ncbi:hypothetical protein AAFC00_002325 [Neodothiora populina]|uniref:TPR-like protein n=1 Tax=Neodothiora populina TaxID=2781224 RepID=A0ABR3PH21_9PEZI
MSATAGTEALIDLYRQNLANEVQSLVRDRLDQVEQGNFKAILDSEEAQALFGRQDESFPADLTQWRSYISSRLEERLLKEASATSQNPKDLEQANYFLIGYACLLAFLQSNITGPPLPFSPASAIFPEAIASDKNALVEARAKLVASLSVDGISAFRLTPNVELLVLAEEIMSNARILLAVKVAQWGLLRARVMHQRLLTEASGSLETKIFQDLEAVEDELFSSPDSNNSAKVQFLLERASIETFHGLDKKARDDLDLAATQRGFRFALTGLLGKRTKFQKHDVSQLVVLAKSAEDEVSTCSGKGKQVVSTEGEATGPKNLDLNDDTLLESISFTEKSAVPETTSTDIQEMSNLSKELADLDPSAQPQLKPLDSIILLALASSITNTSPANGLTREETLPYATRVLEGGSSNWQIYTQALLVRSRMEGYKSRTVERGLLQLQALVDQVIADTTETSSDNSTSDATGTSFLPKSKESESASVSERLRYVFQLASPSRWELEAELAQRWVSLGGLRSALEIYERLEMWAEAALCYAATEKEETAKRMVRRQLYHTTSGIPDLEADAEEETWQGKERDPAPADAARLYCILGDIDNDPVMYEKAWTASGDRYARAQRSLGRYWLQQREHLKAADAYAKSLKANQLNHASWFALGCCLLELTSFERASECFRRCVQLDETDAEAWSNLAAALLKNEAASSAKQETTGEPAPSAAQPLLDDEEEPTGQDNQAVDPQQNRKDALRALKRAATLKHDSHRIWENLLIVAAGITPPDYTSIITAQRQLIILRGPTVGEACIDVEIMGLMVTHVISSSETGSFDPSKPGYERFLVELFDKHIIPLITSSRALWQQVAKLALWRRKPEKALDAQEKAWRTCTTQPGWEDSVGGQPKWDQVVDATVELCDAYETFGPMERASGMGEGTLVAKDWKFKARSAIRGVMGKGKESWEGTDGWERLKDALEQLKN